MTTIETRQHSLFVGGEWIAVLQRRDLRGARPVLGRRRADGGGGHARRRPPSRRGRGGRGSRLGGVAARRAPGHLPRRRPTFSRAAATRSSTCSRARPAATFGFGMFQMMFTPGLLRQAAGAAYAPVGEMIPSDIPGTMAMGVRQPVGVVGAIAPWNAALILSLRSITAPLAFGNTVVLKPSEWSPFTGGLLWGEIFEEAGLPAGVLNIVTHAPGEAAGIGDELVENPAVRRLNFTGSTATGRRLAEAAGRNLKRVVLELGGSNPLIVLGDADLEYAVDAAAFGSFLHQGQICMSARRILVERSIADDFTAKLVAKTAGLKVGDPKEHDTIIGPLINAQALSTVAARVQDAVDRGARVLVGGEVEGACYQPTRRRRRPRRLGARRRGDVRPGRRDRGRRRCGRGSRPRQRDELRPLGRDHHRRRRSRARARLADRVRASSTSTTRRSATSRRCRSEASRTRAGAVSAAAPRWTSSPSCAGSRSRAGRGTSRSERRPDDAEPSAHVTVSRTTSAAEAVRHVRSGRHRAWSAGSGSSALRWR